MPPPMGINAPVLNQSVPDEPDLTASVGTVNGLFGLRHEEPFVLDEPALLPDCSPKSAAANVISINEWASANDPALPGVESLHSAQVLVRFRCIDILIATVCVITLAPIMLLAALAVFLTSPGPIFYSQKRFGRQGLVFGCLKFRTMKVNAELLLVDMLRTSPALAEIWERDRKIVHDPRITSVGHFLRRYSIDELPQLFNVLKGDMSIVGPRPLATDEAHFYQNAFSAYCTMKPGITGPWQISGRNQISFAGRAMLDCEYARSKSVLGDLAIILRTIPVVLRGTGY